MIWEGRVYTQMCRGSGEVQVWHQIRVTDGSPRRYAVVFYRDSRDSVFKIIVISYP